MREPPCNVLFESVFKDQQCFFFSLCEGRSERRKGKEKLVRSCLGQTRSGRAACGAVSLSWLIRSTWPVPHGSVRATENTHTHTENHDLVVSSAIAWNRNYAKNKALH